MRKAERPFDVVLLDYRLPDSADLGLLSRIRLAAPGLPGDHDYRSQYAGARSGRHGARRVSVVSKPFEVGAIALASSGGLTARQSSAMKPTILVVDDEQLIRWSLDRSPGTGRLSRAGGRHCGRRAWSAPAEGVDLVLLDYRLPDADGLDGAEADQGEQPGHAGDPADRRVERGHGRRGDEGRARTTTRTSRSISTRSSLLVEKALETTQLRREVRTLRASQAQPYSLDRIVGDSAGHRAAARAAPAEDRVEPGLHGAADGRERHRQGPRGEGAALRERPRRRGRS